MLQEESGTLQNLQRDKEDLERALGGLKNRLQDTNGPPVVMEAARKQQNILENELSRVHQLLADNSKVDEVPSSRKWFYFSSALYFFCCFFMLNSSHSARRTLFFLNNNIDIKRIGY